MAIQERDREDLFRDGHAMTVRGQCRIDDTDVLVGFRKLGQSSFYFGPDLVFQFNASHELRRVYWNGQQLTAAEGRLAIISRDKRGGKVELNQVPLAPGKQIEILNHFSEWLQRLDEPSPTLTWRVIETRSGLFYQRLQGWLGSKRIVEIAQSPNV